MGVIAPDWFDELVLDGEGPPWLSMGLSRLAPAGWLLADRERPAELALRAQLLAERHDEVFAARPGTEAAGEETLALVRAWLAEHDLATAEANDTSPPDVHPLEAAGRLVQEDLVVMVERHGAFHLDAACLCFPSHWRLHDKFGRPAQEVHQRVPGYDRDVADKVNRFLARLRPDVLSVRRNWSVHPNADLFAPVPPPQDRPLTADEVGSDRWLRSERQTLRRLPATGAVLFTIRVQQAPFSALAARPDVADRLARRLQAQPAALTRYQGLVTDRPALLAWLEQTSARR